MDQAKAKEEFDSAFASFKTSQAKAPEAPGASDANKVFASFNTEFPPISELEKDDDSDSSSDRGGFDDDFAPSSPKPVADKTDATKLPSPTKTKTSPQDEATGASKNSSGGPLDDFMSRYGS
jgi:epidermal growth factor receptor substrate 15